MEFPIFPSLLVCWSAALLAMGTAHAAEKTPAANPLEIHFKTEREGTAMVNVYRADGTLVRRLELGQHYAKGAHKIAWDGLTDDGKMAEPGEYTWKGLFHEGIGLKLRGWVANGAGLPWRTPDGKNGWGGDRGVPSAVAADDKKVYLGWSLAEEGKSLLACDLEGRVQWGHRRSEGPSGCKALAVDDGLVYVLGGLEGVGAEGGTIYRLKAEDGSPVPWPSGALDLKISAFWPADGQTKPNTADAMAVRHGHIYLCFTGSQFLTVLDAKTGEYLQTVVGAAPGMIDVAPTKTELPDAPGKVADADFGLISLGGGVLGRILFAHDPFWVITSDMAPTESDETITALTVIGDGAKYHMHTAFVGFGAPRHQVQARPLLDTENPAWIAGQKGGRPLLGPWQPESLHAIRSVALAADGKLWVAEGDATPKRFSVWDTSGKQGKLAREFFGPADRDSPACAINPLDPDVMFAQGCEWRIGRKTGEAKCLGVVAREPVEGAGYFVGENGHSMLVTSDASHSTKIFERLGDGRYELRTGAPDEKHDFIWLAQFCFAELPKPVGAVSLLRPPAGLAAGQDLPPSPWHLSNEDGFELASFFDGDPAKVSMPNQAAPGLDMAHAVYLRGKATMQVVKGKLYVTAHDSTYWNLEVTGLDKVKALPGGKLTVPVTK